jgi:flavodoxin
VDPYPGKYDEVVEQAKREQQASCKPALRERIKDMKSYDTIFLGSPNWWGTIPRAVAAFLSEYDFSGKTIAPFCTHEGSHLGRIMMDIKRLCPQSTILEGLAVRGRDAKKAQNALSGWLRSAP